ncbi:GroES-like protein [Myriangium duriaei CBS 260.36]|uniref:GroES-like protein n=1 Tax=Myriangium duriaei CBS 260.36 TaxID=1168546 RepID=A0A9P4MH61_9PEZI|nr:GroES-like protein [Myriangium duriaei CBS 260.36]
MQHNKAAYIPSQGHHLEVRDAPYVKPGPDDVIIENHAVAINPVDWKQQDHGIFIDSYPSIFGCDVSGIVVEVGSHVTTFKNGDRVIGNSPCLTLGAKYGAYQLFVPCPANVTCKIPDNMSFETAVVLPLAINTAGSGLFRRDCLNLPAPSLRPVPSDVHVVVYGGSTSNGSAAVQLAKSAGVQIIAIASQPHHDFCTTLGANTLIDYKESDWVAKLANELKGKKVAGAYDSIGTETTMQSLADAFAQADISAPIESVAPVPIHIKGNLVFGTDVTKDNLLASALWKDFLPAALAHKKLLPKPDAKVVGHGLESIQAAMDTQKQGASASKLVIKIK